MKEPCLPPCHLVTLSPCHEDKEPPRMLNNLSRRGFLQRSLTGLTAAGLPLWFAQDVLAQQEESKAKEKKKVAANDRLRVGCIGIGSPASRGMAIMGDAKSKKGVEIVAVC